MSNWLKCNDPDLKDYQLGLQYEWEIIKLIFTSKKFTNEQKQ